MFQEGPKQNKQKRVFSLADSSERNFSDILHKKENYPWKKLWDEDIMKKEINKIWVNENKK